MRVTKAYCDVCKKEISATHGSIDVIYSTGGNGRNHAKFSEICLDCSTAIIECVHKLEPAHVKPADELPVNEHINKLAIDLLGNPEK